MIPFTTCLCEGGRKPQGLSAFHSGRHRVTFSLLYKVEKRRSFQSNSGVSLYSVLLLNQFFLIEKGLTIHIFRFDLSKEVVSVGLKLYSDDENRFLKSCINSSG